jgi:hypothetical protein
MVENIVTTVSRDILMPSMSFFNCNLAMRVLLIRIVNNIAILLDNFFLMYRCIDHVSCSHVGIHGVHDFGSVCDQ